MQELETFIPRDQYHRGMIGEMNLLTEPDDISRYLRNEARAETTAAKRHGFNIVARSIWGARPPRHIDLQDKHSVDEVFIHWPGDTGSLAHINTRSEERAYMRSVQNFHMDAPDHLWSDIGYNYVIFQSGRIYRGRGFTHIPAGQLHHNTGTDAICCILGTADQIPPKMKENLRDFVRWCRNYSDRPIAVRPHKAVTSTTCPGPALSAFVPSLDKLV